MPAFPLNRFAANASLCLAGLLLVLPFSFSFLLDLPDKTVAFFAFHWMALAIGLAAIGLLPWAADSRYGIRIPYSVMPLLGLIGICLYQTAALDIPYSAPYITYITYMVWAITLFILGATLQQSLGPDRLIKAIAWFGLVGALFAALIGLIQLAGVPEFLRPWIISFEHGFPIGNVRHPNFFACHIMLGLLALTYLFGMRQIWLRWFLPCVILLTTVIAFSPSRTIYLYFALVICWAAWLEWRTREVAAKRFFLAISFSFALFLLLQWALLPLLEQQSGLLTKNAAARLLEFQDDGQLFSRIDAWKAAWQMFLQHPLLGGGIGNYPWFHFLLTEHATIGAFSNPHSLPLFYLATTGITGTTLLLIFMLVTVNRLRVLRHDCRYWFPTVFLLVIFIYSMLEFPLWLPAFLGIAAFLCGALNSAGWVLRPISLAAKSIHVLMIAVCTLLLFDTLEDYRKLALANTSKVTPLHIEKFVRNGINNPWLRPYAERVFLNRLLVLHDKDAANVLLRMNTRQLHWLPSERTLIRQPILLSAVGRTEESIRMFEKTSKRYPKLNRAMLNFCENHPKAELELLCSTVKNQGGP